MSYFPRSFLFYGGFLLGGKTTTCLIDWWSLVRLKIRALPNQTTADDWNSLVTNQQKQKTDDDDA